MTTPMEDLQPGAEPSPRGAPAARCVSLGTIVGGIAHELNNPLSGVVANLEFARESLTEALAGAGARPANAPSIEEALSILHDVRVAAERLRTLSAQLEAFARPGEEPGEEVDLPSVLEATLTMLHTDLRGRVKIVRALGAVPPVRAGGAALGHLLLDLVLGAARGAVAGAPARPELRVATDVDPEGRVVVEIGGPGAGAPPASTFTALPAHPGPAAGCDAHVRALGGVLVQIAPPRGPAFRLTLPPR
jgi:C4-dicarboxylate-specific signal transduction histidine kinase